MRKDRKRKNRRAPAVRGFVKPTFKGQTPPAYMGIGLDRGSMGRDILLSDTDPYGSYTGVPENPDERPVQDADDL